MFDFFKQLFNNKPATPVAKPTTLPKPIVVAENKPKEKVEVVEEDIKLRLQSRVVIPNGNPTKEEIISRLLDVEGGYVNNPKDRGGETNYGITVAVANENAKMLKSRFNWNGTMRGLSKTMAIAIYEELYWKSSNLDIVYNISPLLADKIFDLSVNCGRIRAGKWLQTSLNALNRQQKDYKDISVDGGIGNGTINALKSFIAFRGKKNALSVLQMALIGQQANHYIAISVSNPDNEEFVYGWLQRCSRHIELYIEG